MHQSIVQRPVAAPPARRPQQWKYFRQQLAKTANPGQALRAVCPPRRSARCAFDGETDEPSVMAAIGAASLMAFSDPAYSKGCITGALIGGAAGHMAGHGKIGAIAGRTQGAVRRIRTRVRSINPDEHFRSGDLTEGTECSASSRSVGVRAAPLDPSRAGPQHRPCPRRQERGRASPITR